MTSEEKRKSYFTAGYREGYRNTQALYGNMHQRNSEFDDAADEGILVGKQDANAGRPMDEEAAWAAYRQRLGSAAA
jgi:hypothetical protein